VAGNVLQSTTASVCAASLRLQILNSSNVSGTDEATLFELFGKWIDYFKSNTKGKQEVKVI